MGPRPALSALLPRANTFTSVEHCPPDRGQPVAQLDEIDRAALAGVVVHAARDLVQVVAHPRDRERQAGEGLGVLRDAMARLGARLRRLAQR